MPRTATLAFLLLAAPAFAAVTRRLSAEVAKDPALARSAEKRGEHADTLDAKAKALESEPRIASALRAESISAREYVMVHLAALQAGMVAAMKAQGVKLDAAKIGEAMNPANVEFLETHRKEMDEVGRSQQDLQKVSKEANRGQRGPAEEMEEDKPAQEATNPMEM